MKLKIIAPKERLACSFERIYFSRGNDKDIYNERIELGRKMIPTLLETIDHDLENTVFSFIPNTAEIAFYGLVKGMEDVMNWQKFVKIKEAGDLDDETLMSILRSRARVEKIAWKDVKLKLPNDGPIKLLAEYRPLNTRSKRSINAMLDEMQSIARNISLVRKL